MLRATRFIEIYLDSLYVRPRQDSSFLRLKRKNMYTYFIYMYIGQNERMNKDQRREGEREKEKTEEGKARRVAGT